MKMRNATCVGTQTSKVPTRVTLLFINYSVVELMLYCFFVKMVLKLRTISNLTGTNNQLRINLRCQNNKLDQRSKDNNISLISIFPKA